MALVAGPLGPFHSSRDLASEEPQQSSARLTLQMGN